MDWREQKRAARQIVHKTFGIEAQYYASKGATPTTVHVRLQTKFGLTTQDPRDAREGWAQIQSFEPHLVFMRSEKEPENGAVVWLQVNEAYLIDNTLPPDDITRTAQCVRLTAKQYTDWGLPT